MQIICVDKNPYINFYYKIYLEQRLKVHVKMISSYEEVSAPELKKCRYVIFLNKYQKEDFYYFIDKKQNMKLNYKIINIYNKKNDFLPKQYKENSIPLFDLKNLTSLININTLDEQNFKYHYSIPADLLSLMKSIPCDVFKRTGIYYDKIELIKNKIPNLNDYQKKSLYIEHSSLKDFSKEFMSSIYEEYKSLKDHGDLLKFISINYDKIQKVGLSEEDINLVDQKLDFVFSIINEENEDLFRLLSKIYSKEFFIAEHSLMLSFITAKMGHIYFSDMRDINNLIFASLFHDLKLDMEDQDKEINLEDNSNDLKYHCTEIIKSVENLSFFNDCLEDILLFHHELPHGKGLFYKQNFEIAETTSIFIVAHYFINQLYRKNLNTRKALDITNNYFKDSGQPYESSLLLLNEVINI
jgi:HD-GYP domain-containing protein (c-di-GMP phosphodiesterase class II)